MGSLDFGVTSELALVEARIRESIRTEEPLLHEIARYVIESGGKRIRPMVTLLAFRALGGSEIRQAVDLAAAFELIHSATLIHDDINDGGDMRRGRLAAYKKFGLQNALVTGDFLFVKAFGIGGRFDDDIVEITANVCAALAEGEIRQKRHVDDTGVTRSEYLDIIRRKTALPMSAGARVAGLLANARLEHIEAVGDYGINLGMAFQIVDDVLDVVGDASRLGKPPGTDVREGNVTLVTIRSQRRKRHRRPSTRAARPQASETGCGRPARPVPPAGFRRRRKGPARRADVWAARQEGLGPDRRQRCQGEHDPPRRLCPVARHVRRWRNAIAVRRDRGRLRTRRWHGRPVRRATRAQGPPGRQAQGDRRAS